MADNQDEPINKFQKPYDIRRMVDGNTDVFRYGLQKEIDSQFEDPTLLGFTIEIDNDASNALFNQVLPFLEKHSVKRKEHNSRIPIYNDFKNRILQIFRSQESIEQASDSSVYIKSHYINTVSGLNNLAKKFIKWKEDALEIELYEDISLYTSYIASLYNNLVYSYESGRTLIPENLLKFDLNIKISEIRNLTSIRKLASTNATDQEIANALKNNVTCITYKLHDCQFDFVESLPFADSITQSGIGAALPTNSVVNMKIYFKSVSRKMYAPLVTKSLQMNDNSYDLGLVVVGLGGDKKTNGQATSNNTTITNPDDTSFQKSESTTQAQAAPNSDFLNSYFKKPSSGDTYENEVAKHEDLKQDETGLIANSKLIREILEYNAPLQPKFGLANKPADKTLDEDVGGFDFSEIVSNPQKALNEAESRIAKKATFIGNSLLQKAKNAINQRRAELINKFVHDVAKKVGLKKITPANVYDTPNYFKDELARIGNQAGFDILNEINKAGQGLLGI